MVFALTWNNPDGTFDVVEFDTVEAEEHTLPNEVTEFPVEQGPDVTDNVRVKPRLLHVSGYMSDTPLYQNPGVNKVADYTPHRLDLPNRPNYAPKTFKVDVPGSPLQPNVSSLVGAAVGALFGSTPQVTPLVRGPDQPSTPQTVNPVKFTSFESRVRKVFDLLKKAAGRSGADPIIILAVTDYDEIDGLVVENLTMPRSVEDGTGAVITFDLRQITIAESDTVEAPKPSEGLGQKRKAIAKATKEGEVKAAEALKSIAKRIVGGTLSFLPGATE